MEITGILHKKMETKQVSDKFRVREFVIKFADNPDYPQYVPFQLTQDKVDILDKYNEGESLEVHFNLRGREWNGRYFASLEAWRITHVPGHEPQPIAVTDTTGEDDLPF